MSTWLMVTPKVRSVHVFATQVRQFRQFSIQAFQGASVHSTVPAVVIIKNFEHIFSLNSL